MKKNRVIKYVVLTAVSGVLLAIPFIVGNPYFIHMAIVIFMNIVSAVSLRLILRTGQISFGHGAFVAVGAYTSALLATNLGLSFWLTLPLSGIAAALLAAILGYPALRTRGIYFVIITFCFAEALVLLITYWPFLGGVNGIPSIPKPNPIALPGLTPVQFVSHTQYYYLILGIMTVALVVLRRIDNSYLGRVFSAISESNRLSESIGINLTGYKMLAFVTGCFFAGLAGSFFAHYYTYISPNFFSLWESIYVFMYVLAGGIGSFFGPIIGATLLTISGELFRLVTGLQTVLFAILLLLIVFFLPGGLVTIPDIIRRRKARIGNLKAKVSDLNLKLGIKTPKESKGQ